MHSLIPEITFLIICTLLSEIYATLRLQILPSMDEHIAQTIIAKTTQNKIIPASPATSHSTIAIATKNAKDDERNVRK